MAAIKMRSTVVSNELFAQWAREGSTAEEGGGDESMVGGG